MVTRRGLLFLFLFWHHTRSWVVTGIGIIGSVPPRTAAPIRLRDLVAGNPFGPSLADVALPHAQNAAPEAIATPIRIRLTITAVFIGAGELGESPLPCSPLAFSPLPSSDAKMVAALAKKREMSQAALCFMASAFLYFNDLGFAYSRAISMSEQTPQYVFRLKKRARRNLQKGCGLDFTLENPADGRFKDLDCVKRLLNDYPGYVSRTVTSYCHYGYTYRKRTLFISTLSAFNPLPACPRFNCPWKLRGGSHPNRVVGTSQAERNSIPPLLIDLIIESWMKCRAAREYLLLDVFSGWGSIERRVREHQENGKWLNVHVYCNDIVNRSHTNCNLDMLKWNPSGQLAFAVNKIWPERVNEAFSHPKGVFGWAYDSDITVLIHVSTPCETYSLNGIGKHRHTGSARAKSDAAQKADKMNDQLISYLRLHVLGGLNDASVSNECFKPVLH